MTPRFWQDRPPAPIKRPRGRPRLNAPPSPPARPEPSTRWVAIRADLLTKAADMITINDPHLSSMFRTVINNPASTVRETTGIQSINQKMRFDMAEQLSTLAQSFERDGGMPRTVALLRDAVKVLRT